MAAPLNRLIFDAVYGSWILSPIICDSICKNLEQSHKPTTQYKAL